MGPFEDTEVTEYGGGRGSCRRASGLGGRAWLIYSCCFIVLIVLAGILYTHGVEVGGEVPWLVVRVEMAVYC